MGREHTPTRTVGVHTVRGSELSPRTFWNFAGDFSSCRRQRAATGERADLAHDSAVYSGDRAIRLSGQSPPDARARGFRWSAVGDHAAASMDGHLPQAAARLASARARRAAAARAVRSVGTASPLPKFACLPLEIQGAQEPITSPERLGGAGYQVLLYEEVRHARPLPFRENPRKVEHAAAGVRHVPGTAPSTATRHRRRQ